jgi:hypothetical protein
MYVYISVYKCIYIKYARKRALAQTQVLRALAHARVGCERLAPLRAGLVPGAPHDGAARRRRAKQRNTNDERKRALVRLDEHPACPWPSQLVRV